MNKNADTIIKESSLIVVKIGSDLIVHNGKSRQETRIRKAWLRSLAHDVKNLQDEGKKIVIVSSGAIALGREQILRAFSKTKEQMTLHEKQGAAAFGQTRLINAWQDAFSRCGKKNVAQHLLTHYDLANPVQRANALGALSVVLKCGGVPVINENDTVATGEITFGDNDKLAAIVGTNLKADTVILLSRKIDGLCKNWGTPFTQLMPFVSKLTGEIWEMAKNTHANNGTGGMQSKLAAAKIVMQNGGTLLIARGDIHYPLGRLRRKNICSCFAAV